MVFATWIALICPYMSILSEQTSQMDREIWADRRSFTLLRPPIKPSGVVMCCHVWSLQLVWPFKQSASSLLRGVRHEIHSSSVWSRNPAVHLWSSLIIFDILHLKIIEHLWDISAEARVWTYSVVYALVMTIGITVPFRWHGDLSTDATTISHGFLRWTIWTVAQFRHIPAYSDIFRLVHSICTA